MQVLIILTTPNLRHTFLLHMQCSYVHICNNYSNYEKRHYKMCLLNLHIENIRYKTIYFDCVTFQILTIVSIDKLMNEHLPVEGWRLVDQEDILACYHESSVH